MHLGIHHVLIHSKKLLYIDISWNKLQFEKMGVQIFAIFNNPRVVFIILHQNYIFAIIKN